MKKEAKCYFCKKQITDKKDYVIFHIPRFGYNFKIGHKGCFIHYKAKHPVLSGGTYGWLFSYYPWDMLNHYMFWVGLFVVLLAINLFLYVWVTKYWLILAIVPALVVLKFLFLRLYFWVRYE
ncbi:hypothetical protein KY330_02645 [Candidatus Woesearchaeota archaeon]|nr:hypothetical protein [Candidatus Woesearchaeota archaeon]